MFKLIEKLSNVSGLKSIHDDIFFTEKNVLKCNGVTLIENVEGSSFWSVGKYIYYFHFNGGKFLRKGNTDYKIESPLFIGTENDQNILCRSDFRRVNRQWWWKLGVFNFNSLNLTRELPFENYTVELVVADLAIGYFERNKASALDIRKGQIEWELELGQFGNVEVKEMLGVYQNQLLVACSDHLLLSIDVNTGNILRKWRELPDFKAGQFYKDVLPEPKHFVLDKAEAKLIGAFDTYYFEIDLVSGQIGYCQLKDELSKYEIRDFRPFNNNPFTATHLFLTAHTYLDELPDVDLSSVLAFNRQTMKIDWLHVFKDAGLGTNVPQITSTHLYQLDTEKNVYIFERVS